MNRSLWTRVTKTSAPASVILVRLVVGLVFLSEGLQKFMFEALGSGRFEKIGFAAPHALAYLVACFEVICGAMLVVGLMTRLAAIPLMIIILTAIVTTKVPVFLGHDLWGFHVRKLSHYGFWVMAHEARTDFSMLLGSIFLAIVGAGRWSMDACLVRRRPASPHTVDHVPGGGEEN